MIHDKKDRGIPLKNAKITSALENAELHITNGLGHMHILNNGGVSKKIFSFLKH